MKLRPGLIFEVAIAAGIALRGNGDKRTCRCPFHDDRHPSAFLSIRNIFYCARCTPQRGWSLKRFQEALGQGWFNASPSPRRQAPAKARKAFSAADARALWAASFTRARDDEFAAEDAEVYAYLSRRGLGEAWEVGAFGVLPPSWPHPAIQNWFAGGYSVLAPLFDRGGEVVAIQSRTIEGRTPRTLFPAESRALGTVFADRRGQRALAGESLDIVLYGEGLTDLLAYSIASPWPCLAAPGTSMAVAGVGSWALGANVILALDADAAGDSEAPVVSDALYRHGAKAVRRLRWPPGAKDACDVVAQRGVVGLQEFLERVLTQARAS